MAKSAIIYTGRLKIIPFSSRFISKKYVGWLNDSEVMKYSGGRFSRHTLKSCRAYMKSFENSPNYFWAITERDPVIGHLGNINAYVDHGYKIADVGIMIGERMRWGKGYGAEAFNAVIDFLFREAGMRKVTAGTVSENKSMLQIMRSSGMKDDGTRKRHYIIDGKELDVIHMALFKKDWKQEK